MQVPSGAPTSRTESITPALTLISVPLWTTPAPGSAASRLEGRVRSVKCETDAMLGSASPRNPSVRIAPRSSARAILLVACRSIASRASSGSIPSPSSSTRISFLPPSSTAMLMRRAPASSAFSTSSLTTEAGRSTTSPAAIWLARSEGNLWMRGMEKFHSKESKSRMSFELDPPSLVKIPEHREDDTHHQRHQHPEHPRAAEAEVREVDVHAVQAGDERQGHEHRGDDGQHLHDGVQLVRHGGQVRVQQARDAVLEEHRFVGEPHQVIVHVAEAIRHLLVDE